MHAHLRRGILAVAAIAIFTAGAAVALFYPPIVGSLGQESLELHRRVKEDIVVHAREVVLGCEAAAKAVTDRIEAIEAKGAPKPRGWPFDVALPPSDAPLLPGWSVSAERPVDWSPPATAAGGWKIKLRPSD